MERGIENDEVGGEGAVDGGGSAGIGFGGRKKLGSGRKA